MNVKKMFASLTGVLMLAGAVVPASLVGAANYGAELTGAYEYAFSKGITTMTSIDNANMYGEITRGQLAKMISNWAEKELSTKSDETKVCAFSDAHTAEGDLATYLKKSCQMGLMGQGIDAFRPNAKVTRAEFGTVLSRALWGNKYEGATPYYANHLQALKDAGIMTKIETPSQLEIRGYVMLMLQRATAENLINKIENNTGSVNTGVVKAGDLKVTATAATNRRIVDNAVSDLDTLNFTASEDVTLTKVVLERYGYSNNDAVTGVWLENAEGVKITAARQPNNRDEIVLTIDRDYRNMGKSASFTIVAEVASGVNQTIGFKVKSVESSAKNLDISSYTPFTYDVVKYDGAKVQGTLKGSNGKTYQYAAGKDFEVARLQLKAISKTVEVDGITFTNTGTLDLSRYLDKLTATVDGKTLSNLKYTADRNGQLTLSFDAVTIENRKNATFVVNASFANLDAYGQTVELGLADTTAVKAVETKTSARVSLERALTAISYRIAGGQVRLTNTKLASIIDAAQGSTNVVFAEGDLSLAEPVQLKNVEMTVSVVPNVANFTGVESLTLVVAGEEYTASRKKNTPTTFSFGNVLLEKSGKVQLKADLDSEATKDATITISMGNDQLFSQTDFDRATYYDARNQDVATNDVIGSLTLSKIKVQAAKASMVNSLTKDVEVLTGETSNRVLFDGTYTAQKQDVNLRHLRISTDASKALVNGEQVEFTVSVNGNVVDTVTFGSNDYTKDSFPTEVLVKKGEKATVKVTANVLLLSRKDITYKVELWGEDTDGADAGIGRANMLKIKAVDNASVQVTSPANTQNTVLLRASNVNLATYMVKPQNGVEGANVTSLTIGLTGTIPANFDRDSLTIYVNGSEVSSEDIEVNSGAAAATLTMNNLNESLPVAGFEVKVDARVELPAGTYVIGLDSVNGKSFKRTVTKKITDALVKITKQQNRGSQTEFTLNTVGVNGDESITELKLMNGTTVVAQLDAVALGEDTLLATNGLDPVVINKISYLVNNTPVELTSSELPAYFLVEGRGLQTFAITNN